MSEYKSDFTSPAGLTANGWTAAAIRKFLGEPDKLARNPHYRSGPQMRLYSVARVRAVEASAGFQEWLAAAETRKAGARKATLTKQQKLREYLRSVKITVPKLAGPELKRKAIDSYNAYQSERRDWDEWHEPASRDSDPMFLERITVNWLRHELSSYEKELDAMFGRVGAEEGRRSIREKVYAAIARAYPNLAAECKRQQDRRSGEARERQP